MRRQTLAVAGDGSFELPIGVGMRYLNSGVLVKCLAVGRWPESFFIRVVIHSA